MWLTKQDRHKNFQSIVKSIIFFAKSNFWRIKFFGQKRHLLMNCIFLRVTFLPYTIHRFQVHRSLSRIRQHMGIKFIPWGPAGIQVSYCNSVNFNFVCYNFYKTLHEWGNYFAWQGRLESEQLNVSVKVFTVSRMFAMLQCKYFISTLCLLKLFLEY